MSPRRNWLLTVFLLGSAAAQQAAPNVVAAQQTAPDTTALKTPDTALAALSPTPICPPNESFVNVLVGGVNRGGGWIRTGGPDGRTWLDRSVIRSGENGYFDAQLTCDDVMLVRLRPELRLNFDPEQLTLAFAPDLALLGASSFTVSADAARRLTSLPTVNFTYGVNFNTNLRGVPDQDLIIRSTSGLSYAARLDYLQGRFSAFAGVRQSLSGRQAGPLAPSAGARYRISDAVTVQAAFNLQGSLNLWYGAFSGLQAQVSGNHGRTLPGLSFVLPFAADVHLLVDGQEIQHGQFAPGTVTLKDIPLGRSEGQVVVEIDDETGHRSVSQAYRFPADLLASSEYFVAAEGGLLDLQPYAALSAQVGLTPDVTLQTEAGYLGGVGKGSVWVVLAPPQQLIRLGVGLGTLADPRAVSLKGQYRYVQPSFSAELSADVPVYSPSPFPPEPRVEGAVRYAASRFGAGLSGGYDTDLNGWYARLDGSVPVPSARLNVTPYVALTSRSTRVGIGLNWTPTPEVQVQGAVQSSFSGTVGSDTSSPAFGVTTRAFLNVSDQLTPQSRLTLGTDLQNAAASYRYRGPLELAAAASTSGDVNVSLQGRASLVAGRVSFSADVGAQRFILLRTGIPNLRIRAEGAYRGDTDASGQILIAVQSPSGSQIQVDTTTLPIEVSLQSETLSVDVPDEGTVTVDWRDNFTRSRFVVFQDAGGGSVRWPGQDEIDLDDAGEGLLPVLGERVVGTLTFSDGRTCPVTLTPEATTVSCSP